MKKNHKGFTLIEIVIVIAILAILAAVLIPQFTGFQEKARSTQVILDAKNVATAMDAIKAEDGTYPVQADLDEVIKLAGLTDAAGDPVVRNGAPIDLVIGADGSFDLTESVDPNNTDTTVTYGRDSGTTAVVKQ